jgi:ribosomal protein S12 methylthiotransferase accessory factor
MDMHIRLNGGKKVDAEFGGFTIHTDQPPKYGGADSAPSPFDVFLASIGTCAGYFVQNYCQSRGLSTEGVEIVQHMDWDLAKHLVTKVRLEIQVPESFPEQYRASLVSAVNLCTVKKHLKNPPEIEAATHVKLDEQSAPCCGAASLPA